MAGRFLDRELSERDGDTVVEMCSHTVVEMCGLLVFMSLLPHLVSTRSWRGGGGFQSELEEWGA